MSLWSRLANVFRGDRLSREIDEEFASHFAEALEEGRDPVEARKAFGSALRQREESRDFRLIPWLDSLRADVIFGWRQLMKRKVTSAAAILSLALAIGACTSAFRLIDALLLRPLPVTNPERLYALSRQEIGWDGKPEAFDGWAYPDFRLMRTAVKGQAELIAISYAERMDLTYASDQDMEKVYLQYVSGWMFSSFGLKPALGRLFTKKDDRELGAHPYAVLSHDYWARRFGQDPKVIGRSFRMGNRLYEIIGVCQAPFTGTEPGTMIDMFLPTMMHRRVSRSDSTWHRTLALVEPGVAFEPIRQKLNATSLAFETERAKGFIGMPKQSIDNYLNQRLVLEPAPAGVSGLQEANRRSLAVLSALVVLVLLIACANVANLMTAQAAARAREMALRVSIGAGRWRLVQLMLVESATLASLAAVAGAVFAWWSAPFVVSRINPPDNPARLFLPADWRVLAFGVALTVCVTFLLGVIPALRASRVMPATTLKGGDNPHSRRRTMHALIALQVAFCFVVLFVAGLFVATFDQLSNQPTGFSAERLLTLETVTQRPQLPVFWNQVADHLRAVPGVEEVALAGWPLLTSNWNSFVSINGAPPTQVMTDFLNVSPGWLRVMRIPLMDGRDFRPNDTYPRVAIVNEAFARQYFNRANPTGKSFEKTADEGPHTRFQIVGFVRDARYRSIREPVPPVAYVPFNSIDANGKPRYEGEATFIVRTSSTNPLVLAPILRREVSQAGHGFRVSNIRTQKEIDDSQTVRERLLAMVALFFAIVALLLAGIGLYGVLNYSVLQRQREIGIRMAIGARAGEVARRVTADVLLMVLVGTLMGLALGMASVRYITALLYQVNATDLGALAVPAMAILIAALLASVPAVIRAVRIDPVAMLRAE